MMSWVSATDNGHCQPQTARPICARRLTCMMVLEGKLQVDPTRFPRGMRFVADTLHSKGLKLGVYTDIAKGSCGHGPGSYGFYQTDAETVANEWDADYLKVSRYTQQMLWKIAHTLSPSCVTLFVIVCC